LIGLASRVTTRRAVPAKAGAAAKVQPASRGGRPSKAEAEQLVHRIEDAAAELFFSLGYGATTIEAVAKRARVSKRTFYDRFDDKSALFSAVVHRTIQRMRPPAGVPLVRGRNLKSMLRGIAELIMRAALSPQAIALHRLIVAESSRFPDLAAVVNNQGASEEAIRLIAGLLEREAPREKLKLANAAFAAQQFLYMLMTVPQRRAMGLGTAMTSAEVDAWARDTVNLFLNGCRGWDPSNR
jgi:TetR/AcrR family transcriptional regulator, mexJK operon transcriptional repressor